MEEFKITLEQHRGTSYDIGYKQGTQLDRAMVNQYLNIADKKMDLEGLKKIYSQYAPHLLEELSGIADGSGMPIEKAAFFMGYGRPEIKGMGCSSAINKNILIRNYDFTPRVYDARFVIQQPHEVYASMGNSLHVMGRTEGVNEKGLSIALHFVNDQDSGKGLTAGSIIRIVLDTCKNTYEAITLIKTLPQSWSYNYTVGDEKGYTTIVEKSSGDVKMRAGDDTLFCTNHFQKPKMSELNRSNIDFSEFRLDFLRDSSIEKMNGRDVFQLFRNESTPLYNERYHEFFGTLHTFAYLFKERKVLTGIPGGKVLEIDFDKWLGGEDINQNEMSGYLNFS